MTLDCVRGDGPDLTARQFVILTTVYLCDGPHTVRGLSDHLKLGKAAVVRALDTLERHRLIQRGRDPQDKRSVHILRTAPGTHFLTQFADTIRSEAKLNEVTGLQVA